MGLLSSSYASAVQCQIALKKNAENRRIQAHEARKRFPQQEKLSAFKFDLPLDHARIAGYYTEVLGKPVSYERMVQHVEKLNVAYEAFVVDPSRDHWVKFSGAIDSYNMTNEWFTRQEWKRDGQVDLWNASSILISEKAYEALVEFTEKYCK